MTHDRAGFYICWGCLVWVPGFYTSPTLYLVDHPNHLGLPLAGALFVLGVASITVNYLADAQRQRVRETGGNCKVWGRPPELIVARHTTETGVKQTSLLLASGWWGPGPPLSLRARGPGDIPVESARPVHARPSLFVRDIPRRALGPSYCPYRAPMRREIRSRLAGLPPARPPPPPPSGRHLTRSASGQFVPAADD